MAPFTVLSTCPFVLWLLYAFTLNKDGAFIYAVLMISEVLDPFDLFSRRARKWRTFVPCKVGKNKVSLFRIALTVTSPTTSCITLVPYRRITWCHIAVWIVYCIVVSLSVMSPYDFSVMCRITYCHAILSNCRIVVLSMPSHLAS